MKQQEVPKDSGDWIQYLGSDKVVEKKKQIAKKTETEKNQTAKKSETSRKSKMPIETPGRVPSKRVALSIIKPTFNVPLNTVKGAIVLDKNHSSVVSDLELFEALPDWFKEPRYLDMTMNDFLRELQRRCHSQIELIFL